MKRSGAQAGRWVAAMQAGQPIRQGELPAGRCSNPQHNRASSNATSKLTFKVRATGQVVELVIGEPQPPQASQLDHTWRQARPQAPTDVQVCQLQSGVREHRFKQRNCIAGPLIAIKVQLFKLRQLPRCRAAGWDCCSLGRQLAPRSKLQAVHVGAGWRRHRGQQRRQRGELHDAPQLQGCGARRGLFEGSSAEQASRKLRWVRKRRWVAATDHECAWDAMLECTAMARDWLLCPWLDWLHVSPANLMSGTPAEPHSTAGLAAELEAVAAGCPPVHPLQPGANSAGRCSWPAARHAAAAFGCAQTSASAGAVGPPGQPAALVEGGAHQC